MNLGGLLADLEKEFADIHPKLISMEKDQARGVQRLLIFLVDGLEGCVTFAGERLL